MKNISIKRTKLYTISGKEDNGQIVYFGGENEGFGSFKDAMKFEKEHEAEEYARDSEYFQSAKQVVGKKSTPHQQHLALMAMLTLGSINNEQR